MLAGNIDVHHSVRVDPKFGNAGGTWLAQSADMRRGASKHDDHGPQVRQPAGCFRVRS
jgi:hypothetical protein